MEGAEDNTSKGDVILWNENTTFVRDFYAYLWDIWDRDLKKNLYCVVQYLELKEDMIPSKTSNITRELVENEYDLVAYGVIRLNDEFGKFIFGTFTVPLFEGPIFVEELLENKKTDFTLKITVQQPGEIVHPMAQPKPTKEIPPELKAQMDAKQAKILKRQKKRDNMKKAEEDFKAKKEEAKEERRNQVNQGTEFNTPKTPKTPKSSKTPKDGKNTPGNSSAKTPKTPKSKKNKKKTKLL
eukprot:CAMPEP_0197000934 /NCGR_PEP_ID=MMETSP1380-20130617/5749_1 /TAXON_ID=5936 /ORGANISM="Euplotes crassus, Strain CT5" /LENGTH=239 /DNA_ID=CAMNT_0042418401 /DNA_START=217 /DNA_END=936 /DNA_ORIENTATION=-